MCANASVEEQNEEAGMKSRKERGEGAVKHFPSLGNASDARSDTEGPRRNEGSPASLLRELIQLAKGE